MKPNSLGVDPAGQSSDLHLSLLYQIWATASTGLWQLAMEHSQQTPWLLLQGPRPLRVNQQTKNIPRPCGPVALWPVGNGNTMFGLPAAFFQYISLQRSLSRSHSETPVTCVLVYPVFPPATPLHCPTVLLRYSSVLLRCSLLLDAPLCSVNAPHCSLGAPSKAAQLPFLNRNGIS